MWGRGDLGQFEGLFLLSDAEVGVDMVQVLQQFLQSLLGLTALGEGKTLLSYIYFCPVRDVCAWAVLVSRYRSLFWFTDDLDIAVQVGKHYLCENVCILLGVCVGGPWLAVGALSVW